MNFLQRAAKHFVVINAARLIKQEIEKAGLDNLKILAEAGKSIVGTYLNGCSLPGKATYKRDLNALLQMGVSADMLLEEVVKQMPEIAPIIESKQDYKKLEIQELERFLKEN
ncbi:hypothetical protein ES703_16870 [subsurface metagenome]